MNFVIKSTVNGTTLYLKDVEWFDKRRGEIARGLGFGALRKQDAHIFADKDEAEKVAACYVDNPEVVPAWSRRNIRRSVNRSGL